MAAVSMRRERGSRRSQGRHEATASEDQDRVESAHFAVPAHGEIAAGGDSCQ